MKRGLACLVIVWLLSACDRSSDFSKSGTMEEVARQGSEIEALKSEVRRLKENQEFYERLDKEFHKATVSDFDMLAAKVAANAKVQNDNEKIDDNRWNAIRQRVGL